jgi:hypothetical protein
MSRRRTFGIVGDVFIASVLLISLAALGGCGRATTASQPLPGSADPQSDAYAPPKPGTGDFDWVQLKNGEWLKGKIKDLQDESFSFESDKLDTLQLQWKDTHAIYSSKEHTCVFQDNTDILGTVQVVGNRVTVRTVEGEKHYDRKDLRSIIPGGHTELDYWSLKYTLGSTVRQGNTDQSDVSSFLSIQRRSPEARSRFELRAIVGSVEGQETVNNQIASFYHDIFLSPRVYLTAPSVQYYADKFQNIDYRITPGAGLGYELIDRGDMEWTIGGGAGYQYTRFQEVEFGKESSAGGLAILGATDFTWEITEKIDIEMKYNTTIGLDENLGTNQHVMATLSFGVWKDFDFDVSLTWDRVGDTQRTSDGGEPNPDDVGIYVGIGVEF